MKERHLEWTEELAEQLEWHWENHLWPRWEGLTDAEYLWEPTDDSWTIRPRAEATSPMAAGAGDVVIDYAYPEPDPAPVTSIAWRMAHIAVDLFGTRAANHFGADPIDYQSIDWGLTAQDGLDRVARAYQSWIEGVHGLDDEALAAPSGPSEGPYADRSMATLVLHINREAIHHGAEICLLRDLYRRER